MNLRNPATALLFTSLFLVMVGFGIIIPVLPFYVRDLGASSVDMGLLMTVFSLVQFICAPIWGNLSDRIGRKPLLVLGMTGHAISFLMLAFANSLWMLYASRLLGGMLSSAAIPASLAYIADITSEKDRGSGMGLMGAAMGMGMIFGPAIGGMLANLGFQAPFFVSAGLSLATAVFTALMLPGSLPPERRHTPTRRGGRIGGLVAGIKSPMGFPLILTGVATFATANLEGMFAFWAHDRLGLGAPQMGTLFVAMGLTTVIAQGWLAGRLTASIGEQTVVRIGLFVTGAGFLLMLLAVDLVSLMGLLAVWATGTALMRPALAAVISKRAPGGQGAAMGLSGSFDSLGRIVGPLWAGYTYQFDISYPYLTGAAILGLCTASTFVAAFWRLGAPAASPQSTRGGRQ